MGIVSRAVEGPTIQSFTDTESGLSAINDSYNMQEPIVSVQHLGHRYSKAWAIKDINFDIDQKGILGLLGSNGAGKSTTMNILCGVLNQTEGKVVINGLDIREQPEAAKQFIGFLPQNAPLYLDFTVDEYLTYCAHLRLIDSHKINAAVDAV